MSATSPPGSPFLRFAALKVIEDGVGWVRALVLSFQTIEHCRETRRVGSAQGIPSHRQPNTERKIGWWGRRLGHQSNQAEKNPLQQFEQLRSLYPSHRAG